MAHPPPDLTPPDLLPRGVYQLPVLGPHRGLVIIAVTSEGTVTDLLRFEVMPGQNPLAANRMLWRMLNEIDPVEVEAPATAPTPAPVRAPGVLLFPRMLPAL